MPAAMIPLTAQGFPVSDRRQLSSRLLRNTLFNSFGRVAGLLAAFLLTPIVLDHLGAERFGVWALTTALLSYIQLLDLGLGASFIKFVATSEARGERAEINRIVSSGFFAFALLGALLGLVLIASAPLVVARFRIAPALAPEAILVWQLTIAAFVVDYTFSLFDAVIQGLQRMAVTNAVAVASATLQVVATIVVLGAGGGLVGLAQVRLVVEVVTAAMLLLAAHRLLPTLRLHPTLLSMVSLRALWRYGSRVQLARLAELGILQADKIVLGLFVGLPAVAAYEIGARLVAGLKYLAGITTSALVPAAAEVAARADRATLVALYERASKYLTLVAAPMMAVPLLTAPALTRAWLGASDPAAVQVVQALALGSLVHLLTASGAMLARGIGRPELEANYTVLLFALNLALSVALIWRLGFLGALLATPLALVVASLFFLVRFHREVVGGRFLPFAGRIWGWPLGAALLAGLATALAPATLPVAGLAPRLHGLLDLVLRGGLFVVLFVAMILTTPYLDDADWRLLRRLLARLRLRPLGA